MIYVKFNAGRIVATYPGLSSPEDLPGVVAIEESDPRLGLFAASFNRDSTDVVILPVEATERIWRDAEIASVAWLRERHRDEVELKVDTTITLAQYTQLLTYIQELRNWPEGGLFPLVEHRPSRPEWLEFTPVVNTDEGSVE